MPGLDGPEVARLVRADEEIGGTAIIFLSSLVSAARGRRRQAHRRPPLPVQADQRVELVETIEDTLALAC